MAMRNAAVLLAVAVLVHPPLSSAARYDPDPDRAALRQAATLCQSAVVDATGLPLEPGKAPLIAAGLEEGLRQASLAAVSARSLGSATRLRGAAMESAAADRALDRVIKELLDPVAAERLRMQSLSSKREELKEKVEKLPEEEKKKLQPLLAKASGALRSASSAMRPLEDSLKTMSAQALLMKEARRDSAGLLVEVSSAAAGTAGRADELPPAVAEARARLGAISQEPREAARTRAWQQFEILRGAVRLLFHDADRACNRADEFRRVSAAFERASDDFERARRAASPSSLKSFLDEAERALATLGERLEKPSPKP